LTTPYSHYRAMIWLKSGIERVTIPDTGQSPSVVQVLANVCPFLTKGLNDLRVSTDNTLPKKLLKMEEIQTTRSFKFGLMYGKEGQASEEDMFSNEKGSLGYDEFCSILGDKIELNGWNNFRGGLDVKQGKTGTHSIYTKFCGYEIMFHVSTLLPHSDSDKQQLEKKRHIGNDICCVVFQDTNNPPTSGADNFKPSFSPTTISSHFLHVFVGVRTTKGADGKTLYIVNTSSKSDVPQFGPILKNPPVFESKLELRDFILTKLINGETSTYQSPAFVKKLMRTLEGSLQVIYDEYNPAAKQVKKNAAISGLKAVSLSSRSTVSVAHGGTNAAVNNMVLSAKTVLADISNEILCGDKFVGNDYLVGTSQGLFLFDGASLREIKTEKKRKITRVNYIEQLGIVVTICVRQPGGHPYIVVFETESILGHLKNNYKVKETKMQDARLATLYAIDPFWNQNFPFYLVAQVKKQFILFVWQGISKTFKKLKTLPAQDTCQVLSLRGNNLIIGYTSEFQYLNLEDSMPEPSAQAPTTPVNSNAANNSNNANNPNLETAIPNSLGGNIPIAPLDVISLEKDLLICYNNQCMFVDFSGKVSRDYIIKWTSFPHSVVICHPFVLGFMRDSCEVRTLLNGSLIQSVPIQSNTLLSCSQRELPYTFYLANNDINNSQIHKLNLLKKQ